MRKLLILCCLQLILAISSYGQSGSVSGTLTDRDSKPLEGVTVVVMETQKSVLTDVKGNFTIQANPGQTLRFSYIGAESVTAKVPQGSDQLSIQLDIAGNDLNEVVVTGYQTERKKDLTGAVSVVNVNDIKDIPAGNAVKALQGRVPGVLITGDGTLNGAVTVRVRGVGTLGNNDPLYVIDGVPTKRGLQEINQNDIESIQVLKDASAASIYGSRAANGVIIVTTKRAKNGQSRIDFDASVSSQFYATKLQMLNTQQRGEAYWRAAVNDRQNPNNNLTYQYDWNNDFANPVLNQVNLPQFVDGAQTMLPANTNWFDEISQTSILQTYNLSVSNGGERGNSLFSLSYFDNQGIVKDSHNQKYTARFNSDYSFFNGKLRIGENFSATYMKDVLLPIGDIMLLSANVQPIIPVRTISGGWGGPAAGMDDRQNPVRLIKDNLQNKNHFARAFGNAFAELDVLPNLHLRTNFGVDYNGSYARTLQKSFVSGFLSDPNNTASANTGYDGNLIWQNTLTYDLNKGKNIFNFLLGHEQIKFINQSFFGSRRGLALENIDYAYLNAGTTNTQNGGSGSGNALLSYFAKANYTYNDKYLASFTLRRDGSSRFGSQNQYGFFPAVSAGWRISQEDFIKENLPAVSDLKIRYGWGQTGNQDIANYATYSLYTSNYNVTAYDITGNGNGQLQSGYIRIQQGNDALKWETTTQSNIGMDFGLFDNNISGSVDYFSKDTKDILVSPPYLGVIGEGGNRFVNGASMHNSGLEALVSYNGKVREVSFSIAGNIAYYKNKVTELPSDVLTAYPGNGTTATIIDRPLSSIFNYVADGLFTTQEELDNSATQPGKGLGRIRFKDTDGNGLIDDRDRIYTGKSDPDYTYGLNASVSYKNFDFTFFLQGVQGATVYNGYKYLTDFSSVAPGSNWGARTLDAWTPQNPDSTVPALTLIDRNNEGRSSTYLYEKGSYLKLRNVQLAYDCRNLFKSGTVKNARVYVQASNILLLKNKGFSGTDPENPSTGYPIPVITTLGVNFSY